MSQQTAFRFGRGLMIVLLCTVGPSSFAQIGTVIGNAPGVYVDPDGTVKRRVVDEQDELTAMRARMKATQEDYFDE